MQAVSALSDVLPDEERTAVDHEEAYRRFVSRLSHQSVVKHFDAFVDIPWDDPAFAIDSADPRLALGEDDPLGATSWYRALPEATRARIGLHMIATFARIGYAFESVLKRGLLEYAGRLPVGSPEFRYAYHEVIEEAQHSLFFHEFVRRSGLDVRPPRLLGIAQHQIVRMGRAFPELFFLFVLSGEDPIDWSQRRLLRSGREIHPLIERISRIHITEEARHMAFARHFLRRRVPRLGRAKMTLMRMRTPVVFKIASQFMMRPSGHVVRTYGIPESVLCEAYGPGSLGAARTIEALGKPRELCWELGILNDRWSPMWKALGVYAPPAA